MITKFKLDNLVKKYENIDFIKDDPIQFPHLGKAETPASVPKPGLIKDVPVVKGIHLESSIPVEKL